MSIKEGYRFVLDCSVTMAWLFEDETNPRTEKILDMLEQSRAIVPTIWPLEVANVLLSALRKKRIQSMQATSFVDALSALPIHIDESTTHRAMHSIFSMGERENLTIYDAAYLELAIRENIPLATQDVDLLKAAARLKIPIL